MERPPDDAVVLWRLNTGYIEKEAMVKTYMLTKRSSLIGTAVASGMAHVGQNVAGIGEFDPGKLSKTVDRIVKKQKGLGAVKEGLKKVVSPEYGIVKHEYAKAIDRLSKDRNLARDVVDASLENIVKNPKRFANAIASVHGKESGFLENLMSIMDREEALAFSAKLLKELDGNMALNAVRGFRKGVIRNFRDGRIPKPKTSVAEKASEAIGNAAVAIVEPGVPAVNATKYFLSRTEIPENESGVKGRIYDIANRIKDKVNEKFVKEPSKKSAEAGMRGESVGRATTKIKRFAINPLVADAEVFGNVAARAAREVLTDPDLDVLREIDSVPDAAKRRLLRKVYVKTIGRGK